MKARGPKDVVVVKVFEDSRSSFFTADAGRAPPVLLIEWTFQS